MEIIIKSLELSYHQKSPPLILRPLIETLDSYWKEQKSPNLEAARFYENYAHYSLMKGSRVSALTYWGRALDIAKKWTGGEGKFYKTLYKKAQEALAPSMSELMSTFGMYANSKDKLPASQRVQNTYEPTRIRKQLR